MEEIWRDIIGYEGLYQVSNTGKVKSLNYRRTGKEGILNVGNKNLTKGHFFVELWKNKSGCKKYIHILVAEHFIPNPENKPIVHHIDKDPKNNNVDNLMWVTNMEHRELHQEISKIVSRVRSKTIIQYTLNETFVKNGILQWIFKGSWGIIMQVLLNVVKENILTKVETNGIV